MKKTRTVSRKIVIIGLIALSIAKVDWNKIQENSLKNILTTNIEAAMNK